MGVGVCTSAQKYIQCAFHQFPEPAKLTICITLVQPLVAEHLLDVIRLLGWVRALAVAPEAEMELLEEVPKSGLGLRMGLDGHARHGETTVRGGNMGESLPKLFVLSAVRM